MVIIHTEVAEEILERGIDLKIDNKIVESKFLYVPDTIYLNHGEHSVSVKNPVTGDTVGHNFTLQFDSDLFIKVDSNHTSVNVKVKI
jgi:hypothetical protein